MRYLTLLSSALLLAACGGSSLEFPEREPDPTPGTGSEILEIIHASPDAPDVDVVLDGTTIAEGAPYKAGLVLQSPAESISLDVLGLVPGADEANPAPLVLGRVPVIEADLDTPEGTRVTVFAANTVSDIEPIVVTAPIEEVPSDSVRLRVVHAAPIFDPEMVSVFLTGPDDELDAPTETFAFGSDFGPVTVPANDYRIRITPAGDTSTVLFDSGTVELPGGADLVVAAVVSALPEVPLSLLVADGQGVSELIDDRAQSTVRVVHAAPAAPNVDVILNDSLPPAISDLAFTEFTERLPIDAGEYNVKVVPTASDVEPAAVEGDVAPIEAVIDEDVVLVAGEEYSVYALGIDPLQALPLVDDNRRINTEARLRIVHGAPSAGDVDIYLAPSDAELDAPALAAVPFAAESGYLSVAPGNYDIRVVPAGGDPLTPAIGPLPVVFTAGGIYTVVARDAAGGGDPFGVILLDDLDAASSH